MSRNQRQGYQGPLTDLIRLAATTSIVSGPVLYRGLLLTDLLTNFAPAPNTGQHIRYKSGVSRRTICSNSIANSIEQQV